MQLRAAEWEFVGYEQLEINLQRNRIDVYVNQTLSFWSKNRATSDTFRQSLFQVAISSWYENESGLEKTDTCLHLPSNHRLFIFSFLFYRPATLSLYQRGIHIVDYSPKVEEKLQV